jgi:acetyl esterase/lipase
MERDRDMPINATRDFYQKLVKAGVPAIYVEFPQTGHAFDIQIRGIAAIMRKQLHLTQPISSLEDISQTSPAAQAARYYLDRFLALMSG